MEQIYYTQCPVGYGLGASNGFQIKRLTGNYPVSGDFRHFNLRAYPGGTRTLAPRTLRYRRDGQVAEIALLTPRTQEYETERGLWGRPGGHFAHGLRLDPAELASLSNWPAGLAGSNFWKTSDPEPSRGRAPDPVALASDSLLGPGRLETLQRLLGDLPRAVLAGVLSAVAAATGQQRTVFLIDEPDRLANRVAGLTLAFPRALRPALTFSTFHDRPEELSGYRIQGTSPVARPNRQVLVHQGFLVDLIEKSIAPIAEHGVWAERLAGAIAAPTPERVDWFQEVDAVARKAIGQRDPSGEEFWSDAWLDQLGAFPERVRDPEIPSSRDDWEATLATLAWAKSGRLGKAWSARRGVDWFLSAVEASRRDPLCIEGLARHLEFRDVWEPAGAASGWGVAAAELLRALPTEVVLREVDRLLARVPDSNRPSFVQAMLRGLDAGDADAVLERLRESDRLDRAILLPLEAVQALQPLWNREDPEPLLDRLRIASTHPGGLLAVLDALDQEVGSRPVALEVVAGVVASVLTPENADIWIPWILGRGERAAAWLGPWLRPRLVETDAAVWDQLRRETPPALLPSLASTFLDVASDPHLPEAGFLWAIENLIAQLPPESQPSGDGWAVGYLDRLASDLDLIDRLFASKTRVKGLGKWLKSAHERGELPESARRRFLVAKRFHEALEFGSVADLPGLTVPTVPPRDRGRLMRKLGASYLGDRFEGLDAILSYCRAAWPDGFRPGAEGLGSIGDVVAGWLLPWRARPDAWADRLDEILERLGVGTAPGESWGPDGLAAFVLLRTNEAQPDRPPWTLREFVLNDPARRRALALEIASDLAKFKPLEAPLVFERWDARLPKSRPEPFHEVFLNACDGPRMAAVVADRPSSFRTLRTMSWWQARSFPDAVDDIRDAFARLAPVRPFPEGTIGVIDLWLNARPSGPMPTVDPELSEAEARPAATLSPHGQVRWKAIQAITQLFQAPVERRESQFDAWRQEDLVAKLAEDDRYNFAAWLILALPFQNELLATKVGAWCHRQGIRDAARVAQWRLELAGQFEVEDETAIDRAEFAAEIRRELLHRISESRGR